MKLTLVAAVKFEIEHTLSELSKLGIQCDYILTGIGAIESAKNCYNIANFCKNKNVVFLGSAGTFNHFKEPFLATVSHVEWLPTANRLDLAYTVQGSADSIPLPQVQKLNSSLVVKKVICSPSISLDNSLPTGYNKFDYLENLELYSCIKEINQTAKNLSVILGITNSIGKDAHKQWLENFKKIVQLYTNHLKDKLNV